MNGEPRVAAEDLTPGPALVAPDEAAGVLDVGGAKVASVEVREAARPRGEVVPPDLGLEGGVGELEEPEGDGGGEEATHLLGGAQMDEAVVAVEVREGVLGRQRRGRRLGDDFVEVASTFRISHHNDYGPIRDLVILDVVLGQLALGSKAVAVGDCAPFLLTALVTAPGRCRDLLPTVTLVLVGHGSEPVGRCVARGGAGSASLLDLLLGTSFSHIFAADPPDDRIIKPDPLVVVLPSHIHRVVAAVGLFAMVVNDADQSVLRHGRTLCNKRVASSFGKNLGRKLQVKRVTNLLSNLRGSLGVELEALEMKDKNGGKRLNQRLLRHRGSVALQSLRYRQPLDGIHNVVNVRSADVKLQRLEGFGGNRILDPRTTKLRPVLSTEEPGDGRRRAGPR
ncbi:hypothetical protein CTA1_6823 [Colletotrichum tanaceti]|uniref:Uncharacterized protein n=1 Tax=Colletotrichum tanaceti TaxID=1306861 RepID=A0A4U6XBD7_9PEZI|nr:hypothetical protein CTA1_6823 [Colletotrichum tanaceti]